ncbi:MAG: hypothetical protein ACK559_15880, partial [bacterium]
EDLVVEADDLDVGTEGLRVLHLADDALDRAHPEALALALVQRLGEGVGAEGTGPVRAAP